MSRIRRIFLTGLAALFPILITVFLLHWLYSQLDRTIGQRVNAVCRTVLVQRPDLFRTVFPSAEPDVVNAAEARQAYAEENFPSYVGLGIGILVVVITVYAIGLIVRGYVGSRIVNRVDRFFERFPVIKAIYPHARQVADFLFGSRNRIGFRRVVAVQYPRRGLYTVGFLTGDGLKDVQEHAGQDLVSVFIPTSPAPLTGFVILAPREDVMDLDMGVEEAIRFCMTAGMAASRKQRPWKDSRRFTPEALEGMVESNAGDVSEAEPEADEDTS